MAARRPAAAAPALLAALLLALAAGAPRPAAAFDAGGTEVSLYPVSTAWNAIGANPNLLATPQALIASVSPWWGNATASAALALAIADLQGGNVTNPTYFQGCRVAYAVSGSTVSTYFYWKNYTSNTQDCWVTPANASFRPTIQPSYTAQMNGTFVAAASGTCGGNVSPQNPCRYVWVFQCPDGGVSYIANTPYANYNATVGYGNQYTVNIVNTTLKPPFTCLITGVAYDNNYLGVIFMPRANASTLYVTGGAPTPTISGGNLTINAGGTATLDASSSSCGSPPCTYAWTVTCPAPRAPISKSGVVANVSSALSGSGAINVAGLASPMVCNVTLTVTDSTSTAASANVFLTVLPTPPYAPFTYNATEINAGETVRQDASNGSCFNTPCTYAWSLLCPDVNISATASGVIADWTTGPPSSKVPMYGVNASINCDTNLTVTDAAGLSNVTSGLLTVTPIFPMPNITANASIMAGQSLYATTAGSVCGPPDATCTSTWAVTCEVGGANVTQPASASGASVSLLAAGNGAINTTGLNDTRVCYLTVTTTSSYALVMSASVSFNVTPVVSTAVISGLADGANVTAGATVAVTSDASTCAATPCTFAWQLICTIGGTNTTLATRSTGAANFTSGPAGSFAINTFNLSAPQQCYVGLTITDANVNSDGASIGFLVVPASPACFPTPDAGVTPNSVASIAVGQVCTSRQNFLKGVVAPRNRPPPPFTASLVPITDPQGFSAQLVITDVITNRAQVDCSCDARRGQNCTCVSEVVLTSNSTLQVQQQGLLPGSVKGRLFRISYSVTVPQTGLATTCTAELCSILNGGRPRANKCLPFASSGISRSALTATVCPKQSGSG